MGGLATSGIRMYQPEQLSQSPCNECSTGVNLVWFLWGSVASAAAKAKDGVRLAVRPWVRYWGRMFDLYLFTLVLSIPLAILYRPLFRAKFPATVGLNLLIFFLWIFLESLLLSWFGTTPGKSLFKTRLVLADNPSIPYSAALNRSFKVWWRGLGAGIPFVIFFTLGMAEFTLNTRRITSWDREGGFLVVHEKISIPRWIGVVMFDVLCMTLSVVGIVGKHRP